MSTTVLDHLIEREIKRLDGLRRKNRGNHQDTGNQRYYNLMVKYEDQIVELERSQSIVRINANQEQRIKLLIANMEEFVANLRKGAPDDENLISVELYLVEMRRKWGRL